MPLDRNIKKVLVIGSGPIVIGQAAEFDYAGTQACRVLKDAGVNVVLVNSNPATIMTDSFLADEIYLEPLNSQTVKRIILKEKPDSLLAALGGQTGLTIAMQLSKEGFLASHGVRLLGTKEEAIEKAEDRQLFRDTMIKIGQPVIPSGIASTVSEALDTAERIGYPVIVRPAFTLGGAGGGVAYCASELSSVAENGILLSPIDQILVEKYIFGWKEIEFEVMRDGKNNSIAVCSMENVDPVGIHTGDSIVVSPALTLSDKELQMLRSASLDIIGELGIEGGCNCQFALDPNSFDYAVIEVNPRVSRSSALASKATGYPIAKVTTKIALGYTLDEIKNDVTGKTCACFEPALDYVVVKLPKWPFDKFAGASRVLGTQMKATGEVMAIADSFECALMKAIRGAEIGMDTLERKSDGEIPVRERLGIHDDKRIFTIFEALCCGISVDEIFDITRIDRFFLHKIAHLASLQSAMKNRDISEAEYREAKKNGFTDRAIARLTGRETKFHSQFSYRMVDTCAGEFKAETPYFYSVPQGFCEAREHIKNDVKPRIIVLGSGPIRIGQGIEFDYSSVHCVRTLKELGYEVVIINNNPETVSTDFDTADRLYFEPLTPEDVMNVIEVEHPLGAVVTFGGQTAINLAAFLEKQGVKIFGTSAACIDLAEDRKKFDDLLGTLGIRRPQGHTALTVAEAISAAESLGFPVLLRPSYVIGGHNMTIAYTVSDIEKYMEIIVEGSIENPVLIDKYLMGTELEVDCISDGYDVFIPGIMEHIERSGVHSGDSIAVHPPYNLTDRQMSEITECSIRLSLALGTRGLVNIQYLICRSELFVIEVNPRASRTIPYISKVTGVPMVDIATRVMLGQRLSELGISSGLAHVPPYYAVKVPVFSFEKLQDVNSALSPEMKSTGEVLGVGGTLNEALFKGLTAAGFDVKKKGSAFLSVSDNDKFEIVKLAKKLDDLGIKICATEGTAKCVSSLGIDVTVVGRIGSDGGLMKLIDGNGLAFIVMTAGNEKECVDDFIVIHREAVRHSLPCLTSLDTANAFADILAGKYDLGNTELVDINDMRVSRRKLKFCKMEGSGNDYIFFDNFDSSISCPESLCIAYADRHYGIGGDGVVMIESSQVADAKMRIFNKDGSEGKMAGNCIRCVGKYLYDNGIVKKENITVETASGIKRLKLYFYNGKVGSATVDMGRASLLPSDMPVLLDGKSVVNRNVRVADGEYDITCVSMGNPHCVVFCKKVDDIDVGRVGPLFENDRLFPERVNTEFVRVVDRRTLKMRVWERGNGETLACGTGACAAAVASVECGYCDKDCDITVKLRGGDLTVSYTEEGVFLTGNARLVFTGEAEL